MLILTRRPTEIVVIGGVIEVEVTGVRTFSTDLVVRKPGQPDREVKLQLGGSATLGEGLGVSMLGAKGNQVRLGFLAPREVSIHRLEVQDRIKRENAGARVNNPPTRGADHHAQ